MRPLSRGAVGRKLEDRVERQMLQPADVVQLLRADTRQYLLGRRRVALVAVVVREPEQRPVGVQEPVVHGPGVDAHRGHGAPARSRPQPVQHALVEGEYVPVEPVGEPHRRIGEAVRLGQLQFAGADPAGDHPAAGGAQVHRGEHRVVP